MMHFVICATDQNSCTWLGCDADARCISNEGGATCQCQTGFAMEDHLCHGNFSFLRWHD